MSTDTRTLTFDSTSDANFRAWGSGIAASLVAAGLVQTSDTGQINWTTVSRGANPGTSVESIYGYEIYRFNDALQATKPVFIKVEYGVLWSVTSGGATATPSQSVIYITVGTSTNGAGTVNSAVITSRNRYIGGTVFGGSGGSSPVSPFGAASASSPCYTCGDGSSVAQALGITNNAQPIYTGTAVFSPDYSSLPAYLLIERSRNADGTANGDGLIVLMSYWNHSYGSAPTVPTSVCQYLSFVGGGSATPDSFWPLGFPGTGFSTGNAGADFYA
jgi:hypothetical protein